MINNLPIIYKKINKISNFWELEKCFFEVCNLIDQNFEQGFSWISLYSYYNLFKKLLDIEADRQNLLQKYLYILSKVYEIVSKIKENQREVIEILINNPFDSDEFKQKISQKLAKDNLSIVLQKIDEINSILPELREDTVDSLNLSTHDLLKTIKIIAIKGKLNRFKFLEMIVSKIDNSNLTEITEIVSDIIDFGIKNQDDFSRKFVEELLLRIVYKIYHNYENFGKWRTTFVISSFENISRYFRIVKNFRISSLLYLMAAIENWEAKNYGYCAKCIYKIAQMSNNINVFNLFTYLSIQIAKLEVSFQEEIEHWKNEISTMVIDIDKIDQYFRSLLDFNCDDQLYNQIIEIINQKIDSFIIALLSTIKKKLNFSMN